MEPRPVDYSKLFNELNQIVDEHQDPPNSPIRDIAIEIVKYAAEGIETRFNLWADTMIGNYKTNPTDKSQIAIDQLQWAKTNLQRIIKEMGL